MNKLVLSSLAVSVSAVLLSTFTLISTPRKPCPTLEVTGIENLGIKETRPNPPKPERQTVTGSIDMPPAPERQLIAGCLDIKVYEPPTNLSIRCGTGKEVIKIYSDGRVEIPDGVSLTEAARMFWDAVRISFPEFKQAIISEYEKEKKNE